MEEIKPDNKDFRIAELHVEGLSNPQIADALGINRSTVYRRLQTPQCKAVVNEIRNIYHNSLIARLHNLAAKVITAYDKKVIDGDVTAGDFLTGDTDPLMIVTNEDGAVTIYTSSLSSDKPSADGDGVIANIDFTISSGTGVTSLIFDSTNVIFLDVDGNSIAVTGLENGYIYVN